MLGVGNSADGVVCSWGAVDNFRWLWKPAEVDGR